ncbi:MAG: TPM domain-containing protein [Bacteroidetes bacterium]|nr:TPM domain-containing protein [Bacteroidota bacterium]
MYPARFRSLSLLILFLVWTLPAVALEPPELRRYVTDLAGVLSSGDADQIERMLEQYDRSSSSQFLVLIIPTLEGESLEDYSLRVVEKNRIGREGSDNGLLLLVAVNDRKMRFEVGYGLEPVLTDALTSVIISDVIAPRFRNGDYANGIYAGMQAAIQAASGEFTISETAGRPKEEKEGNLFGLIIFLVIMFIIFRGNRRGGRGGGIWFIGGPFSGGGFGGGGFGGGSFGGFSGGGGSFGGGGSSGGW